MPGVGSGPIRSTSTPAATKPGLERRLEHVARDARVLADEHAAALGREDARRGARQPQREIHRHRRLADAAPNAVSAEILSQIALPSITAFTMRYRIERRSHVMGAHDAGALLTANAASPRPAVQPLGHSPSEHPADEALARDADE